MGLSQRDSPTFVYPISVASAAENKDECDDYEPSIVVVKKVAKAVIHIQKVLSYTVWRVCRPLVNIV